MARERGGKRLPLAHQARQLLYGLVALERDRAHAIAVGVESRVAERPADLLDPTFELLDLALDVLDAATQVAQLRRRLSSHDSRDRFRCHLAGRCARGRG